MSIHVFEVEKKATIDDRESLIQKIKTQFTIQLQNESQKEDIYFSTSLVNRYEEIKTQKHIFRVRLQNGQYYLTLKEKKLNHHTEVNHEYEVLVDSQNEKQLKEFFDQLQIEEPSLTVHDFVQFHLDDWKDFFLQKGFFYLLSKNKKTQNYQVLIENQRVNIEINHIDHLGDFVEIEILCSKEEDVISAIQTIDHLFHILEIPSEKEESRLYLELLFALKSLKLSEESV